MCPLPSWQNVSINSFRPLIHQTFAWVFATRGSASREATVYSFPKRFYFSWNLKVGLALCMRISFTYFSMQAQSKCKLLSDFVAPLSLGITKEFNRLKVVLLQWLESNLLFWCISWVSSRQKWYTKYIIIYITFSHFKFIVLFHSIF